MSIIRFDHNGNEIFPKGVSLDLNAGGPYLPFSISPHDAKAIGSGKVSLHVVVDYKKSSRIYDLIGEKVTPPKIAAQKDIARLTAPKYDPAGGNAAAYILMWRRWPDNALPIMSLKDDAILAATGIPKDKLLAAINGAMAGWQAGTSGKIFNPQANLTTRPSWKLDGCNDIAFVPGVGGWLAATGVWHKTTGVQPGGMSRIVEASITINASLKWTCDPAKEPKKGDLQSVILHELGHVLGLGDLYNRATFKADTRQVMHYYTGVKRVLGNGDCTGLWKLYG